MNDTLSDIMSLHGYITTCTLYNVHNRVVYYGLYTTTEHADAVVPDNNDTQCNTILLDNIVGLLTNQHEL